jgi:hypothetical protein
VGVQLSRDQCLSHVIPLFAQLLKDASSEVRLYAITAYPLIVETFGPDGMGSTLFAAVLALFSDKQWRVRHALMESLSKVAKHLVLHPVGYP